jgi:hypothetical protein
VLLSEIWNSGQSKASHQWKQPYCLGVYHHNHYTPISWRLAWSWWSLTWLLCEILIGFFKQSAADEAKRVRLLTYPRLLRRSCSIWSVPEGRDSSRWAPRLMNFSFGICAHVFWGGRLTVIFENFTFSFCYVVYPTILDLLASTKQTFPSSDGIGADYGASQALASTQCP